jgi:hypothetical protein
MGDFSPPLQSALFHHQFCLRRCLISSGSHIHIQKTDLVNIQLCCFTLMFAFIGTVNKEVEAGFEVFREAVLK